MRTPDGARRPAGRAAHDPDGLLLVDKPAGWTSHDVVAKIRGHFGLRKVGHGGTLDPMATGLLVVLVGRGTKLSQYVMGTDKIYEGTLHLGVTTDTDDVDGKVTGERPAAHVTREVLEAEMRKREGDLMQTPPMVSAIKKDGVPLYKLARRGQTVEREPRLIHLYEFSLLAFEPPNARFRLRCTKGTYVRTLCAEVGEALGCGAFLEQLRRTRSGRLDLDQARPLKDLLALDLPQFAELVLPPHTALAEELG
ncbi:MAG: tRNA pseudouridine(55) synthase TruB [Kiritimatiellae bacterium]|nr:tRNA pseudouridine(55) synthase TruB [Kiritimatiellia bacterium]